MDCGAIVPAIETFNGTEDLAAACAVSEVATTVPFPPAGNRSLLIATKAMAIRTEQAIRVKAQRRERLAGEQMRRSESMA